MSPPRLRQGRRPSRTLARALAGEILKAFLLMFAILEVIHGTVFTVQAVRDHGFDLVLLFPIFRRAFAYALFHAVPLAILFAAGLVFGRLVADRGIAALRSFGISHLEVPGSRVTEARGIPLLAQELGNLAPTAAAAGMFLFLERRGPFSRRRRRRSAAAGAQA